MAKTNHLFKKIKIFLIVQWTFRTVSRSKMSVWYVNAVCNVYKKNTKQFIFSCTNVKKDNNTILCN